MNMWDRQKCSGFWVVEQSRGIIEHSFHVMCSAHQPTLSLPQLHFSGKSIPPQPHIFVSSPLKQVIISISPEQTHSLLDLFFPVSFQFLAIRSNLCQKKNPVTSVVKPCAFAHQHSNVLRYLFIFTCMSLKTKCILVWKNDATNSSNTSP